MGTYYLYADESGTMPAKETDGPFVGAIVGARSPITLRRDPRWNQQLLIDAIKAADASPWLCEVVPAPGYGEAVSTKYSQMNTMARARRLVTGRHEYFPDGGFSPANLIWGHCLTQTISPLLVSEIFRAPVTAVEVVFDQKTLATGERSMFVDKCGDLPERLREILVRGRELAPAKMDLGLANLQFTRATLRIRWSDDPTVQGAEHGLRLAHWLAKHHLRHLRKPQRPSIHDLMAAAGWKDRVTDVTQFVTMPPPEESLAVWKRDTGLPVPEA